MEQGILIEIGLPISLFIVMVGMGMTLTARDFHNVALYPRATIVGSIAQIVVLPLVAFALAWALDLSGPVAVGLVVIAACPGGTTSNLFAFLARGNVALSIVLTVLASLVTILTLPLFTNVAMDLYMRAGEEISLPVLKTVATLVVIVLIPVALGMAIRAKAPAFAQRSEAAVGLFGLLVLAALIVGIVLQVRDQLDELIRTAGIAAVALNLVGIALGFIAGRFTGLSSQDALTVAIELGIKNGTLGLLVTLTLLESSPMSTPSAVYSIVMFAVGAVLVAFGRRRADAKPQPAQA